MADYDAGQYERHSFLRKEDLRTSGPRVLIIKDVEETDGLSRNGKPPERVLQLVFTDEMRLLLRTQENLRRMRKAYGDRTSGWIGKPVTAYYSPDVPNPSGEPGGIRLRFNQLPSTAV